MMRSLGEVFPSERRARSSATSFHARRSASVNLERSLSMSLAQFWQSHMPLSMLPRCSEVRFGSKRLPPDAAAVM